MNKKSLTLPMVIALLGVLLMLVSVFLPYLTADGDVPDELSNASEVLLGEDLTSFSMIGFARFCDAVAESVPYFQGMGVFMYVLVGILAGFVLLALLFVLLKKPIPATIFVVLSVAVFFLQGGIFQGAMKGNVYTWGMAYYIYLVAAVVAVAGSIWLKVCKVKASKQIQEI